MLQPSEERRRTGSHYTPRSLTETLVQRTLEPLLATLGPERTAEQLMQLKRENRELKRANEIMHKTSAFFARAELGR